MEDKMEAFAEEMLLRDRIRQLEKALMALRGIIEHNLPDHAQSDAMRTAHDLLHYVPWGQPPSDEESAFDRQRIRTGGTDIPEGGE